MFLSGYTWTDFLTWLIGLLVLYEVVIYIFFTYGKKIFKPRPPGIDLGNGDESSEKRIDELDELDSSSYENNVFYSIDDEDEESVNPPPEESNDNEDEESVNPPPEEKDEEEEILEDLHSKAESESGNIFDDAMELGEMPNNLSSIEISTDEIDEFSNFDISKELESAHNEISDISYKEDDDDEEIPPQEE